MSNATAPVIVENIPAEMKDAPRWVVWRYEDDGPGKKPKKMPYRADDGTPADSTDPATWCDFNTALAAYEAGDYSGLGFVLGDGFAGIDLDDCLNDSGLFTWGDDIIADFPTYVEVSPSGNGVKCFGKGVKTAGAGCKKRGFGPDKAGKIEVYDCDRYFTVTGQIIEGKPAAVVDCQPQLTALCEQLWPPASKTAVQKENRQKTTTSDDNRVARCRAYLAKLPPAVSGQGGHDATYQAAMECFRFGLSKSEALAELESYNTRCTPPWNDKELAHKIQCAKDNVNGDFGCRLREENDTTRKSSTSAGPTDVPADATPELSAVSVGSLLKDFPQMRPPLIDGVLRMTETMNMIDAAKGGKTHTAIDLALSVATGRAWLGRYAIANPGAVLYIDAELHQNTMSRRIASICSARGIFSDEIAGKLDVLSLRGRLRNIFDLRIWLADHAGGGKYRLIVFDALYRLIPEGIDENSNSDMTRVFNCVDQIAEVTGAACLIIHHASKGVQSGKSIVDVGSGASAMARATDSHIIFRQHSEDGCKVLEMAGRSWPPLAPVVLRWEYPTWNIDDTLDPTDLRENNRRKRREDKADDTTPAEAPAEPWTPARFAETFASDTDQPKALIAAKARQAGIATRTVDDLIRLGLSTGQLHRWTRSKSNEIRLATIPQPITETGATNGQ